MKPRARANIKLVILLRVLCVSRFLRTRPFRDLASKTKKAWTIKISSNLTKFNERIVSPSNIPNSIKKKIRSINCRFNSSMAIGRK